MDSCDFAVVLHDVAPATWPFYKDFVAMLDGIGDVPLTLLVVPDMHRHGRLDQEPAFIQAMEERLGRGDELVLHGYYHDDPGPIGLHPYHYCMRRLYTHEGEFYSLGLQASRRRLEDGVARVASLGWPVHGLSLQPGSWAIRPAGRCRFSAFAIPAIRVV